MTNASNADTLHVHAHSATTGQGTDDHHAQSHTFAGADHTASTKTNVDNLISDASLISTVAGEINGLGEKAAPIGADLLLIEDSEDTNSKKKIEIGNIPIANSEASATGIITTTTATYTLMTGMSITPAAGT